MLCAQADIARLLDFCKTILFQAKKSKTYFWNSSCKNCTDVSFFSELYTEFAHNEISCVWRVKKSVYWMEWYRTITILSIPRKFSNLIDEKLSAWPSLFSLIRKLVTCIEIKLSCGSSPALGSPPSIESLADFESSLSVLSVTVSSRIN